MVGGSHEVFNAAPYLIISPLIERRRRIGGCPPSLTLRESERAASNTPLGGNGRFVTIILSDGDEGFAIAREKRMLFNPKGLSSSYMPDSRIPPCLIRN